jgi:FkbM family methyltransferase
VLRRCMPAPAYQSLCEKIARLALAEMGVGTSSDMAANGELAILRGVPDGGVVFDVGANRGEFAAAALRGIPRLELHCFEPSPVAHRRLAASVSGATLNHFALGAEKGALKLYADAPGSGMASLYRRRLDHFGLHFEHHELVPVETLDDYCESRGVRRIDLLKLDVEGHELAVLRGARRMLERGAIDTILFEFGGTDIDSRTFLQDFFYLLAEAGMRLHRLVPPGYLHPIAQYAELYEQFAYTNYVARRRARETT